MFEATELTQNDTKIIQNEKQNEDNPYAYLNRNEFTSEKFKIEVRDLPRFYGISELKNLLNKKLQLNAVKIKTPKGRKPWVYICFRNEEDKIHAINTLNGFRWKGRTLSVKEAKPMPDPLVKKRKDIENSEANTKKPKIQENVEKRLKDSTIPYWNIPYDEQLKENEGKKILRKLLNNLIHINPELKPYLTKKKQEFDGLPCELLKIRYGKTIEGYRNKCEFSIGINEENGLPTVGFRLGSYVNGITSVGPVDSLIHIPKQMITAVKLFENFVRASKLEVFDSEHQSGHYRQLLTRYAASSNQLMLVVCIHPQKLTEDEINSFKQDLVRYFTEEDGRDAGVTSLYYQKLIKKNPGDMSPSFEHLHGDKYIYETLLGLKFKISPESFFQINTETAEILYSSAMELVNPTMESTVIDICCGTGTIGLCFANKCAQVLGVEIVPQAVANARENAIDNNISNAEFFNGAAEEILSSVMQRATSDDIIAIVDPPRAGLHNKAVEMLRRMTKLNKLVYLACNPQSAAKNFVSLGRPQSKSMRGDPFIPVRAVFVDMFPYTKHFELLIYFERWNKNTM